MSSSRQPDARFNQPKPSDSQAEDSTIAGAIRNGKRNSSSPHEDLSRGNVVGKWDRKDLSEETSDNDVSLVRSYRKPTISAVPPLGAGLSGTEVAPMLVDRKEAMDQQRHLLADNNIVTSSHSNHKPQGLSILQQLKDLVRPSTGQAVPQDEESTGRGVESLSETTPLLEDQLLASSTPGSPSTVDKIWEDAVLEGRIQTTWKREAKVLSKSAAPLVLAFFLEYSLTVASIFSVGHIGKVELGAATLASMTANITGFAIYNGLATALDTLCPQAWGSKKKKLVGLQTQRMVFFLWTITIPIGILWLCADLILMRIVPEKEVALLAGKYLKILTVGAPGYALFESAKRYLQAQGLFSAPLYILLVCAPLNAFMNWLFVWKFHWGFEGAPIAVVVTDLLLAASVICYIRFRVGLDCWPGFTKEAFRNWQPMIRLAVPGFLMVEAEVAAFELLSLFSSYLSTTHLAAQGVLFTLCALTFQTPFSVSIATSNRIASLIGASLSDAAKVSAKVAGVLGALVGTLNVVLVMSLRNVLPRLFTSDAEVGALITQTVPVLAAFQLFDALATCCNGVLRGLGRQAIGGYVSIFAYYAVAMPISLGAAFGLHWQLRGLWAGVAVALFVVVAVEMTFLGRSRWEKSVEDAQKRNENG